MPLPHSAPNGLPAESTTKPMCSRKNALCRAADSVLPFPASPRSPSGSPPENAQSRNEQTKSDNRTTIRERASGDPDPRRNRNETYRKPSCLALTRQTAGVIKRKTFREERMSDVPTPRRRLRSPVPRVPSFPRRDRRQKTRNPEVNQPSPITARQPENARMAISTHGGMGTKHIASRPVWHSGGKQQA